MNEVRSHVRLDPLFIEWRSRPKDWSASFSNPMMERPGADSEEKREPVSDIDTVSMGSLKALDPNRPIREADMRGSKLLRCKMTVESHFAGRKLLAPPSSDGNWETSRA
jgi:hypothetical protein